MMNSTQYRAYWPKTSSLRFREKKVKEILETLGLTTYAIAIKIGTSQPTVYRTLFNQTFNEKLQMALVSFFVRKAKQKKIVLSADDLLTARGQKSESPSNKKHAA